ncbi:MAG: pyrroloquinoline quinone-dependent dehydrogenase [Gammaproteobacteria bacterium]|jgi:quinoprotein glucose dehydrogenase|nr:pyrroloquinoline quinone-dependent dehydrogenase [Gammaproteobacteria bacterium]HJN94171.1 PQQ-binding-like beta-propeller repeat protein [Gammaproteobacteria bacterium]
MDEPADVTADWRHAGGGHASAKYAALDQIDTTNFADLEIAWRYKSPDLRLVQGLAYGTADYRAVPLVIDGTLYVNSNHGQVSALDPASGEELWMFDPQSYLTGSPIQTNIMIRGIEFWTDGEIQRLFIATLGKQLISIDIDTGQLDPNFGDNGFVDLRSDLGRLEFETNFLTAGAAPIAVGSSVIVGSKIFDYGMFNRSPPGHVRAYDTYTGTFKWRFNTVPQDGEPYNETWEDDSWRKAGNTNVWTFMSADDEAGIVYLPTSTPTNDYWGGMRLGENLFAESLVALNADTGERIWHFQTVHHGLWDYDIASAPNLVDIVVDGRPIKAVAQVSKTAFTYVFDRLTGEPVWPIEERPVAASTVPGERTNPTQPFPTKPAPFDRQGVSEDDLIDFTPEIAEAARELASNFVLGPLFTPPIVRGSNDKLATFVVPGAGGGANFPGATVDPETGILYIPSATRPHGMSLIAPSQGSSDWPFVIQMERQVGPFGLPLLKPPYRRITAIDLNTGEHVWQIPFGKGPVNHPMLQHLNLPDMGSVYNDVVAEGGVLVTKTLLVSYLAQKDEIDSDAHGSILVALDKQTGEKIAEVMVEQRLHGPPMSFMHEGKQYIAVAGGGRDNDDELIAFALPD